MIAASLSADVVRRWEPRKIHCDERQAFFFQSSMQRNFNRAFRALSRYMSFVRAQRFPGEDTLALRV